MTTRSTKTTTPSLLPNKDITVAWLTPHAAVAREDGDREDGEVVNAWDFTWDLLADPCGFGFHVDGKVIFAMALSPKHLLEICDVVLRLLAASVVHSVVLYDWDRLNDTLINAPTLAYFMEQCQSLKGLSLKVLQMDENHCRVLGAYSRPGLEIELTGCKFTSTGTSALTEVLGRNQGPTKLNVCENDNFVFANGSSGNSRLKSLRQRLSDDVEVRNQELLAIAGALRENKGLVDLDLSDDLRMSDETWDLGMSDETWEAVCGSVETHPTLEVLDLRSSEAFRTPAKLKSWIQALGDMMKVNMSIHTIELDYYYCRHKLFKESVIPYLETNRLWPRLLAIQKTLPQAYRAKVLGRALLAVRTDPNRFWMLLSGNTEVAFPSTTATTTLATNLPTPATAVATENVTPVVASASATAASSVVASAAGQQHKACPKSQTDNASWSAPCSLSNMRLATNYLFVMTTTS
jgi:hypothetical protein